MKAFVLTSILLLCSLILVGCQLNPASANRLLPDLRLENENTQPELENKNMFGAQPTDPDVDTDTNNTGNDNNSDYPEDPEHNYPQDNDTSGSPNTACEDNRHTECECKTNETEIVLLTPSNLSITNNVLSWDQITTATTYKVFLNNETIVFMGAQNHFNISGLMHSLTPGFYYLSVQALTTSGQSEQSNNIQFIVTQQLPTVHGLQINENYLTWIGNTKNATSVTILLGTTSHTIEAASNSFYIGSLLNQFAVHTILDIQIRLNGCQIFLPSGYSNPLRIITSDPNSEAYLKNGHYTACFDSNAFNETVILDVKGGTMHLFTCTIGHEAHTLFTISTLGQIVFSESWLDRYIQAFTDGATVWVTLLCTSVTIPLTRLL